MPRVYELDQEETGLLEELKESVYRVFLPFYGDKWDEGLWAQTTERFEREHDPEALASVMHKVFGWESWDDARTHFIAGPPEFMREGWVSPLMGERFDLEILDEPNVVEWIKGSQAGWRESKLVVIEFWASWCSPCYKVFSHLSALAAEHGSALKIISLNNEDILGEMPPKDIPAMVLARDDMSYSVGLDSSKIMYGALYHPAGRLAIPTAIAITTADSIVRYVGTATPQKLDEALEKLL